MIQYCFKVRRLKLSLDFLPKNSKFRRKKNNFPLDITAHLAPHHFEFIISPKKKNKYYSYVIRIHTCISWQEA